MKTKILEGHVITADALRVLREEVGELRDRYRLVPSLAYVLVGENPAAGLHWRGVEAACRQVGTDFSAVQLGARAEQLEIAEEVRRLNSNADIHGIILDLPLPPHLDQETILGLIDAEKDVDGLSPYNLGQLASKEGRPRFIPSTAKAVLGILEHWGVRAEGTHAMVIGRSNIVGFPVAHLLLQHNATVTICHSHTRDLGKITRQADILVAAIGRPEFIRGKMIKPGAVVIDVGINQVPDPSSKNGYRVVGDVATSEVMGIAQAITPVPGGVGPVSVAMLLENLVIAAVRQGRKSGILPESYRLPAEEEGEWVKDWAR